VKAINIRAKNNYIDYPTIVDLAEYASTPDRLMRLINKADILVLHSSVKPFFESDVPLTPKQLEGTKKLVYFHGSDLRIHGEGILKEADEYLEEYHILVSTPDLLRYVEHFGKTATWMPGCRSFTEIPRKFNMSSRDRAALRSFGDKQRVKLGYTNMRRPDKGYNLWNKVITDVVRSLPHVVFQEIMGKPWAEALRLISRLDLFFDQWMSGAYGMSSVEASIFKIPVVCRLEPSVAKVMEKESGVPQPFIQFSDYETGDDLRTTTFMLCDGKKGEKLRETFGKMCYDYCKAVHNEKPVAERFLKIVGEM